MAKSWAPTVDTQTWVDASATAESLGLPPIRAVSYENFSPVEFSHLGASNHRARLGASLDEMFPLTDRPRGLADIDSVKWHMQNTSSPAVMFRGGDHGDIVLDGAHRIIAAFLTNSTVRVLIVGPR